MISCAAIQKLERYGYLGLKRHSTDDFVSTSIKDPKRANVYALTLLETWQEAVQAIRGHDVPPVEVLAANSVQGSDTLTGAPARFTDALVYAVSFAVALTTHHALEVQSSPTGTAPSALFPGRCGAALQLLATLKDAVLAISSGRALRSNAASDEFTKAVAHLLTNGMDLVMVLLATHPRQREKASASAEADEADVKAQESMLAHALVLVAAVAQMLRRVQATYPVPDLYATRPCAALLRQVANKHKQTQQQQQKRQQSAVGNAQSRAPMSAHAEGLDSQKKKQQPLFAILCRYVDLCAQSGVSAAGLFASFSLFQRLSMLHGTLSALVAARPSPLYSDGMLEASRDVQHWLSQLLASTACNRATRYVVYFREDELRLMQHNIRQASDYALYTFTTTPPVDPGLVESLLGSAAGATEGSSSSSVDSEITHARAALVLAQWCVSAPFFFESFCQDETWAAFAQEQRRLVLLQQSRARRGMHKSSAASAAKSRREKNRSDGGDALDSASDAGGSRASSLSSRSSDTASDTARGKHAPADADTASLLSFQTASHLGGHSIHGSVTSLASRVSLLSTFSKHSAASYLSFLSVLRPSTAGSVAGGARDRGGRGDDGDDDGASAVGGGGVERQLHESEDGNTNLPLILLEQLTLGLHRFMESYPVTLLDQYGLRSISWSCIARMFGFVEASLTHPSTAEKGTALLSLGASKVSEDGALTRVASVQPLFSLAQDLRYNKGMGYECLGLLFAKAIAPLLDVRADATPDTAPAAVTDRHPTVSAGEKLTEEKKKQQQQARSSDSDTDAQSDAGSSNEAALTEDDVFAQAAAAAATSAGRATLSPADDDATRRHIEGALSRCLTAYETVAPQVVDMNLPTILRLAARTASASPAVASTGATMKKAAESAAEATKAESWSSVLLAFLQDITRRLGRSNELPHLVDALLGRGENARADAAATSAEGSDDLSDLCALRSVFRLAPVRAALTDAAGMSLDPESLLLHLNSIAAELEDGESSTDSAAERAETGNEEEDSGSHGSASAQRALLTLEVMEAVLEGVTPTSVSASAVLEQTTQLELLLTASFVTYADGYTSCTSPAQRQQHRGVLMQHACTIRQCRAVTALCLQDLGSQQVREYLSMLDETLWQLSSDVGQLLGSLTVTELQPLLAEDGVSAESTLLLASLALQRLALARAVCAALETTAGPQDQLQDMVGFVWDCIASGKRGKAQRRAATESGDGNMGQTYTSLVLVNQMSGDDWVSLVGLGKEKHARAALAALLQLSTSAAASSHMSAARNTSATTDSRDDSCMAWLPCCLRSIPGTTLRALVDFYVTLSVEDACGEVTAATTESAVTALPAYQQWLAVLSALTSAYAALGHNPYWPSMLSHTVRALTHVSRVWRKAQRRVTSSGSGAAASSYLAQLSTQLLALTISVLRSESRSSEVLRKSLLSQLRESVSADGSSGSPSTTALSRSGMSLAYVEAIRVPAAVLSDLAAPTVTPSHLSNEENTGEKQREGDGVDGQVAAEAEVQQQQQQLALLKERSFEDEMRELCTVLFHTATVKHLLAVADLSASAPREGRAVSSANVDMAMGALAFLYQVCLATAQAAWRARLTGGDLAALRNTAAVEYVEAVAGAFYARSTAQEGDEEKDKQSPLPMTAAATLLAFLRSAGTQAEEQALYVHIATQRGDAAHAKGGDCGALDGVEHYWMATLCRCASAAATTAWASMDEASTTVCEALAALLARLLSSAPQRSAHAGARGAASPSKRPRRGDGSRTAAVADGTRDGVEDSCTQKGGAVELDELLGTHSSVTETLRRVLALDRGSEATTKDQDDAAALAHQERARQLRMDLAAFFTSQSPQAAQRGNAHTEKPRWWRVLQSNAGDSARCAWWLLWKFHVVAALSSSSSSPAPLSSVPSREAGTLADTYSSLKALVTSQDADSPAHDAVALRAFILVLRVLPAEALPPLLLDHLQHVLTRAIPDGAHSSHYSAPSPQSLDAVLVAGQVLVELFRVRPRLPSWRLLPHAQRLLVWLTHPRARAAAAAAVASASLSKASLALSPAALSIQLSAAVVMHPAAGLHAAAPLPLQPTAALETQSSELVNNVWLLLLALVEPEAATATAVDGSSSVGVGLSESEMVQLVLLLTKTWLRSRRQPLWSRPAMLPPVMVALFTCMMRGMESGLYSPRVVNVFAGGLAAVAAHVDAATAEEGEEAVAAENSEGDESDDESQKQSGASATTTETKKQQKKNGEPKEKGDAPTPAAKRARPERADHNAPAATTAGSSAPAPVSAALKRMALTATTAALFEVSQHYVHVFTTYSSDMDFLFTDFLRVLSEHFLPKVTRPPIAYHAGVRIGGTTQSEMTFADLAFLCVGNAESKSLLKQAALRMEEEDGGAAGAVRLTDGSRSIFHVA